MSNQAEYFACEHLSVSCLYGLAVKNLAVFLMRIMQKFSDGERVLIVRILN